jgi:hypothetical protein
VQLSDKVGDIHVKNVQQELETAQKDDSHLTAKISTNVKLCVDSVKAENVKIQTVHLHVFALKDLLMTALHKLVLIRMNATWACALAVIVSTTKEDSFVNVLKTISFQLMGHIV